MSDDPFPPDQFDPWAESYDQDVASQVRFPFAGYEQVLRTVVGRAEPRPGISVLDLGTGTGNLALRLAQAGCELWCTDFSGAMLERARAKLPQAHLVQHDLRAPWPAALDRPFDRIVSAYVFHHFELDEKVRLCAQLVPRLEPLGKLILADISFPDPPARAAFAASVRKLWEDEPYWLAHEALDALTRTGLAASYEQVSACAGVYVITGRTPDKPG